MSDLLHPTRLVHVEPDLPSSEPRHQVHPGVAAQATLRLLVGYNLESPPLFDTRASKWTTATREFGYWVIGAFETTRQLWLRSFREYRERPPGVFRKTYRLVRRRIAAKLLLPRYQLPPAHARMSWDVAEPGFEASRLVFEVKTERAALKVICHVFAERQGDAGRRLLEDFIDAIRLQEAGESTLCDVKSRLCLLGHSSFRFRRRQYWEITIGPAERLMDLELSKYVAKSPNGKASYMGPAQSRTLVTAPTQEEMSASVEELALGAALPDATALQRINERAAFDWKFINEKIGEATSEGRDLDEHLVEALAHERYEKAREEIPVKGNGLTLESSRRIVREVVEMHRIASEDKGR